MRVLRVSLQFAAFAMLFLFIACASPTAKFSSIWKDETYQLQPEKILVISTFKNPAYRKLFEDAFVKALKGRRKDAVVSYTIMPDMPDPVLEEKVAISLQAKAIDADAVLINRPLETTQNDVHMSTGLPVWKTYINTRTDVYDTKSNKLIMSVSAEAWLQKKNPYDVQIQSYIKDLVSMMSQHRLLEDKRIACKENGTSYHGQASCAILKKSG